MKMLSNKLICDGDKITEKDLLTKILNGQKYAYVNLASIIPTNKMDYDDAYAGC